MRNGSAGEHLNKKRNGSYRSASRTVYLKGVQRGRQRPVTLMVCVLPSPLRIMWSSQSVWDTAVLDQIQDEWEPCTSPDVRPIVPCEGLSYNTKVARSLALWISRSNFSMNRPREKTCALFNLPSVYYSTPSRDPLIVRSPLGPSLTVSDPPHRKPPGVCRSTTPPRINAGTTQQYPTIYEGSPSLFDGSQGVLRQQTRGSSADVVTTANFGGDDTDIGPNV